jgi:hypothetical protein
MGREEETDASDAALLDFTDGTVVGIHDVEAGSVCGAPSFTAP